MPKFGGTTDPSDTDEGAGQGQGAGDESDHVSLETSDYLGEGELDI